MLVIFGGGKKRARFAKGKIADLLRALGIPQEEALVKVNGALAPDDAEIDAQDKVEVIRIVFGG